MKSSPSIHSNTATTANPSTSRRQANLDLGAADLRIVASHQLRDGHSDRGCLRLYLLQPRRNFIEVDHTIPIINDHVPVEVDPATDERDISGRQAARHNFMWLRSHGYRRSGAPGAAAAMKSVLTLTRTSCG